MHGDWIITFTGGIVAGFGDLREVELLVEAGFTALEAIKIASFNGARFFGEDAHIGSLAVGKEADLMVVRGNPAVNIRNRKGRNRLQGWSRLRLREADPVGAGAGGNPVKVNKRQAN
jgi:adenine deaminase